MIQLVGAGSVVGSVPGDPAGVSPSDLSGLELWLKANNSQFAAASDGDQISGTWNDSSGNGRNATAVAAGITPTYPKIKLTSGPNSFPAIRMVASAIGGWFTLPNFLTGFTSGSIFIIVKLDADPPSRYDNASTPVGNWTTSTAGSLYPFRDDNKIYEEFGTSVRKDAIAHTGKALTSWRCYEIRSASGAWSNHMDGSQLFSTATNTVAWGTTPFIAHTTVNGAYLEGLIAEVIFYSRVLTSSERFDTIHTYLNNKYALGLPTS